MKLDGLTQTNAIAWEVFPEKPHQNWSCRGECTLGMFLIDAHYIGRQRDLIFKLMFTANEEGVSTGLFAEEIYMCQCNTFVIANSQPHLYPDMWAREIAGHLALGWLIGKTKSLWLDYDKIAMENG